MIYPNFLYHPDSGTELFIDTVQQTNYITGCVEYEYTRAATGFKSNKSIPMLPTATFECTWTENHVTDIYRYMDYLKGKRVILCFGPLDLASYAEIINASMPVTVGTTQKVSLQVKFLGSVRGQFREAEDSRCLSYVGTIDTVADVNASGGYCKKLDAYDKTRMISIIQSDIVLPAGDYTLFARVRDSAQVADDVMLRMWNHDDGNDAGSDTHTATSGYTMMTTDFTIDSGDAGDEMYVQVRKSTSTANNIYVDFLGFVKNP